jgi:hypothetical protein
MWKEVLLVFITILLFSCNYERASDKGYTILEEKNCSSFYISDITIDTAAYEDYLSGIKVTLQISQEAISAENNSLKSFGKDCNGYEINIQLCGMDGKLLPRFFDDFDSLNYTAPLEKTVVSVPENSSSSFFFPYRSINIPHGSNEIIFHIQTFPVITSKDSFENPVSKRLSEKFDISEKLKTKINFPEVHTARLYVKDFFLDTDKFDPSSCDVHIFGPGYPDPMFRIYTKDHMIYSSQYFKNSLSFKGPELTGDIKFTDKDYFTFDILDYDSWGRSDILAEITASPNWISHDTLKLSSVKFGYLKYLNIAAVIK